MGVGVGVLSEVLSGELGVVAVAAVAVVEEEVVVVLKTRGKGGCRPSARARRP